jgi:CBS domain-containing protein
MVLFAKDIVEKNFLVLPKETTVLEAAEAMKKMRRGFVLTGTAVKPEGMVTEWDIVEKVVAENKSPALVRLEEIMTRDVLSVDADEGIAAVARLMSDSGVRRILVTQKGAVIGVITSKTILSRLDDYVDVISSQISRLQAPWF